MINLAEGYEKNIVGKFGDMGFASSNSLSDEEATWTGDWFFGC